MASIASKQAFFNEIDQMPDTLYAYAIDEDRRYIFVGTFNVKTQNKVIGFTYDLNAFQIYKQGEYEVPFCITQIQLKDGNKVFVAGSEILVFDYALQKHIYRYENENIEDPSENNAIFGFNPFPLVGFVFAGEYVIGLTQQNILCRKLNDLEATTEIVPLLNFQENFCRFTEYSFGEKRFLLVFYRIGFAVQDQITGLLVHDFQNKLYFNVVQNSKEAKCNEQRIPGAFLDLKKLADNEYKVLTTNVVGRFKVSFVSGCIRIEWVSVKQHAVKDVQSINERDGITVAITIDGKVYVNNELRQSLPFSQRDGYGSEILCSERGKHSFFAIGADLKLLAID